MYNFRYRMSSTLYKKTAKTPRLGLCICNMLFTVIVLILRVSMPFILVYFCLSCGGSISLL